MSACRRHYPGRTDGTDSLIPFHQHRPSPDYSWVGSRINSFEACSTFTHVTTCRLAKSPYATLYTGGSGGFVASTAAPIVTGWSDPVPGRVFSPAVVQCLSRRTVNAWLQQRGIVPECAGHSGANGLTGRGQEISCARSGRPSAPTPEPLPRVRAGAGSGVRALLCF